ncbi:MAG: replication-associated recombination protein A [Armatimonadota bacterium]
MSGLFEKEQKHNIHSQPLAARMRPKTLDDFTGQNHILSNDSLLRKSIESDEISSMIFWGPPGCGKSTLANIIANTTKNYFENFSAVTSGVPELRKVIEKAKSVKQTYNKNTILFIDEIHRFNKAQQDALLPYVEDGTVILIGATTENPYFEVNSPLISRSRIFKFEELKDDDIEKLLKRALSDEEKGLGKEKLEIDGNALKHIINLSNGDARSALYTLELSAKYAKKANKKITLDIAEQATQQRAFSYDKDGDQHYDIISAYIKSMRGSDPDGAVYWLSRMLNAGEDPKFIARRLVIQASEDIGNADPMAMVIANAAAQAVMFVGMPEAQIPLAQATIYLACAPKSNASYIAIKKANDDIKNKKITSVPMHLRDSSYSGAKKLGHGKDYKYPHDYPNNYIEQEYVNSNELQFPYYEPTDNGHEAKFKKRLESIRGIKENKK